MSAERLTVAVDDQLVAVLPGVMQVQVEGQKGYTWATAARAAMQFEPDAMLLGAIPDPETLALALEAALSGVLVVTVVYASRATKALQRLLDMGADPHLLGGALNGVICQRLARRLCSECRVETALSSALLAQAETVVAAGGLDWGSLPKRFHTARGCDACRQTGYHRSVVVAEVLEGTQAMEDALARGGSAAAVEAVAAADGMVTIAADAVRRAALGEIPLDAALAMSGEAHV
jgi:type II secretory ATPase GspE/PulE/Tfp pilus assembly ATPase PilB-like protein